MASWDETDEMNPVLRRAWDAWRRVSDRYSPEPVQLDLEDEGRKNDEQVHPDEEA